MGCFITIFVQHKKITKQVIMVAKTCLGDRETMNMLNFFTYEALSTYYDFANWHILFSSIHSVLNYSVN